MFYHTSSELGVEAVNRLQLQEERIRAGECELDNCGKMSLHDSIRELYLTEKRVMNFIYELNTKIDKAGTNSLVSIPFISKTLNIHEDLITSILTKNGFELTTVEDEEDE